jgi:hypothetical protein
MLVVRALRAEAWWLSGCCLVLSDRNAGSAVYSAEQSSGSVFCQVVPAVP